MSEFLGVTRERVFSPGKVEVDRSILEVVAESLRRRGHGVLVVSADDPLPAPRSGTTVFTMSQGRRALATLHAWERDGIRVVNSVASIRNCHRHRQLDRYQGATIRVPESIVLSTAAPPDAWPAWFEAEGGWLKRGDVHATEARDILFTRERATVTAAVREFRARAITCAVLQRHVAGVVIKFYAVATDFLAWYPPPETPLVLAPDQRAELGALAHAGARALGLEVYGGDCVADSNGTLWLIDVNDWPSYAPCRITAAGAIAARLERVTRPGIL